MNFVPRTQHFTQPEILVPYLGIAEYDGGGFHGFPKRKHWDRVRLHHGDYEEHPPDQTESFFQSWLYFALFCEVLQVQQWNRQDFISHDDQGNRWINAERLPLLMKRWKIQIWQLDTDEQARSLHNAAAVLSEAARIISDVERAQMSEFQNGFLRSWRTASTHSVVRPDIILSIKVLIDTLSLFHKRIQDEVTAGGIPLNLAVDLPFTPSQIYHSSSIGVPEFKNPNKVLEARMLKSGWCIETIYRMSKIFSSATMLFASDLQPLRSTKDHTGCRKDQCNHKTIDEATYQTNHCTDACACNHLEVSQDELARILQEPDGIPLVTVKQGAETSNTVITVVCSRKSVDFVAFSHVWSDGLGNPNRNSLPTCQLRRLQEIANQATAWSSNKSQPESSPNATPFWLDTLCIPLERALRRTAIARINHTFQNSALVVALDAHMQSCSFSDSMTLEEQLMYVIFSGWMCRLWTLQEAATAPKLLVRHQTGFLDLWESYRCLAADVRNIDFPYSTPRVEIASCLRRLMFFKLNIRMVERFSLAWGAAEFRRASKLEDETVILAGLLKLDPTSVIAAPVNEQLRVLYSSMSEVPRALLFLDGPRNSEPGFRWIVRGFTRTSLGAASTKQHVAQVSSEGLSVSGPGFISLLATANLKMQFYLVDIDSGRWCQVNGDEVLTPMKIFDNKARLAILMDTLAFEDARLFPDNALLVRVDAAHQNHIKGSIVSKLSIANPGFRVGLPGEPSPNFQEIIARHQRRMSLGLPPVHPANVLLGRPLTRECNWVIG